MNNNIYKDKKRFFSKKNGNRAQTKIFFMGIFSKYSCCRSHVRPVNADGKGVHIKITLLWFIEVLDKSQQYKDKILIKLKII